MASSLPLPWIHPLADCQTTNIGLGTRVWQFTVVLPGASLGSNCNINSHCFIENDVVIGNNVTIKCGVYLWDGLTIEDDVFIGPNVTFTNDNWPRSKHRPEKLLTTRLRQGVSLGAGAVVLPGIDVGVGAFVAAGSVVTKDVPPRTLVAGVPARVVRGLSEKEVADVLGHCSTRTHKN